MKSKFTEISQRGGRLTRRYPTTCAVALLYIPLVVLNVILVSYEWTKTCRMSAALHTYNNDLPVVMMGFYLLLVFTSQVILFVAGVVIALIVDLNRSKIGITQTQYSMSSSLITIVSIFLLLPAWWIYRINPWSLWHDMSFQITASPQQKLNRDFMENVLNWGYNRAKIEEYLNKGADINLWGYHGTPLILATQAEDEEFVRELISRGANVNTTDTHRKTALTYALEGGPQHKLSPGRRRIALSLIEHRAGPQVGFYDTPLSTAIRFNRDKELIAKLLDTVSSLDKPDKVKLLSESLMTAASYGNNNAVLELLEKGANINFRTAMNTPLTSAIQSRHLETARLLVSKDANVNVTDQNGASALMLAAGWRSPELLNLLLKAGASVSGQDNNSDTVLSYAARTGDVFRVKKLISLGAKVDPEGRSGKMVIAAAIDANSPEMVKLFIDLGVNVTGDFYPGPGTLLKKATIRNSTTKPEIVRLLREAGARE